MGTIKDRNGKDLTEAKYIKKRWLEYTEELYKKDLHDADMGIRKDRNGKDLTEAEEIKRWQEYTELYK